MIICALQPNSTITTLIFTEKDMFSARTLRLAFQFRRSYEIQRGFNETNFSLLKISCSKQSNETLVHIYREHFSD